MTIRPTTVGALAVVLAATAIACGQDLTITPVRNLERPADLDFVCMGLVAGPGAGTQVASGLPMSSCHDPNNGDRGDAAGESVRATFGLLTNSARAEVGAISFVTDRLVDLDHRLPGYNMVPVGAQPEVLSVSDDGCQTVTANRGSCDLSLIDNSRLLADELRAPPATEPGPVVGQVRIRSGSGELLAAPAEIVFVPPPSSAAVPPVTGDAGAPAPAAPDAAAGDAPAAADAPGAAPDAAAPAPDAGAAASVSAQVLTPLACTGASRRAIVTFPRCDLVAMVELPSGQIVSSFRLAADGSLIDTGTSPQCAAECAGGAAGPGGPDAGSGGLGLAAMAVMPEENRLYLGAARLPVVLTLGLGPQGLVRLPGDGRIPLAENAGGVDRLRLSREPGRKRGERGAFVGKRGRFLYAFAQDGSVRVIELDPRNGSQQLPPHECDVNVDTKVLQAGGAAEPTRGCFPLSLRLPRNMLAQGPGLRPPQTASAAGGPPPAPVDISFAEHGSDTSYVATGYLLASNSIVYHVLLDSGSLSRGEVTHSIRRDPGLGPPMVNQEPTRSFSQTGVAFPTKVGFTSSFIGPRPEGFGRAPNSDLENWLYFPRPDIVSFQSTEFRWEGGLPGTSRTTGRMARGPSADKAGILTDVGADFCAAGVEPGDVLTMVGCNQDQECLVDNQEVCYRASPGAQGVCLPRNLVSNETLIRSCEAELSSRRRYEIRDVFKTRLDVALKPDEVPLSTINPCTPGPDPVCQPDLSHQADPTLAAMGDRGFQCIELGSPRCLKACGVRDESGRLRPNDDLCRAGHVCVDLGNATVGPLCVEAPAPRPECATPDVRYIVQAGKSYTVDFRVLPYFSRTKHDPDSGRCVPDTTRNPLLVSRIPLTAPACQKLPATKTVDLMVPGFSLEDRNPDGSLVNANPCLLRERNDDGIQVGNREDPDPAVKALFENPHARMMLTNLQTYVGDAALISIRIDGGFDPLTVISPSPNTVRISLGVRIVTGPMESLRRSGDVVITPAPPYLYVVDQGRTLSLLSRGQILRINPRPINIAPGGYIELQSDRSLFPIQ